MQAVLGTHIEQIGHIYFTLVRISCHMKLVFPLSGTDLFVRVLFFEFFPFFLFRGRSLLGRVLITCMLGTS